MTDEAILAAYGRRDARRALELLAARFLEPIEQQLSRRLARYRDVPELAQSLGDVVHEALLRVHGNLSRQADPQAIRNLAGWVWRDVQFELAEQIRRALGRRRETPTGIVPAAAEVPLATDAADREHAEDVEAFTRCVEELPAGRPKDALHLRLRGRTLQEVAGQLGYPHPTAVHRAIQAVIELLRRCMRGRGRLPDEP